ncbi:hypothetical protein P9139_15540 [Curtobacterium flaccumfaciens]|nr:hypothetical protein P9139_15540 [Curtobacterium flaccumfaciens]
MSPFAARCLLVGAAVVLVAAGVFAPMAGSSRAALIGAAGWCAVLDALLARATRAGESIDEAATPDVAVLGSAPAQAPDLHPFLFGHDASDDAATATPAGIVLGSAPDGSTVGVGDHAPAHVVIVGGGVLSLAVYRAVVAQVRARSAASGVEVRAASALDLRPVLTSGGEHCPAMPEGTAAVVAAPGTDDETTVVLVTAGRMPRRWDLAVEVTRYGCSVRRPGEPRGTPVSPVLPRLEERA